MGLWVRVKALPTKKSVMHTSISHAHVVTQARRLVATRPCVVRLAPTMMYAGLMLMIEDRRVAPGVHDSVWSWAYIRRQLVKQARNKEGKCADRICQQDR
eukprot:scaffold132923_cov37-Tisochrysis_lutea.AAC.4